MSKYAHDDIYDAALDIIASNANIQTLCSQVPTTRTQAVTTYKLSDAIMSPSDFPITDGDISGRKIRVAAKPGELVDTTGTGTHVALCDDTRLLIVTQCVSASVVAGQTTDFPQWDIEIRDPG